MRLLAGRSRARGFLRSASLLPLTLAISAGCVPSATIRLPVVHSSVPYEPARRAEPRTFRIVDARAPADRAMYPGTFRIDVEGSSDPMSFLAGNLERVLQEQGIDIRRTDDTAADLTLHVRKFRIRNAESKATVIDVLAAVGSGHARSGLSTIHTFATFRGDLVTAHGTIPITAYSKGTTDFEQEYAVDPFTPLSRSGYEIPLEALVLEIAAKTNRFAIGRSSPPQEVAQMITEVPVPYAILSNRSFLSVLKLGLTNNPSVVPTLAALTDHKQGLVRMSAISALGILGADQRFDLLKSIYGHDDALDRLMAAKSIGDLGTPQARTFLKEVRASEAYRKSESLREVVDLYDLDAPESVVRPAAIPVESGPTPSIASKDGAKAGRLPEPAATGAATRCDAAPASGASAGATESFATIRSDIGVYVVASRSVWLTSVDGKPSGQTARVSPGAHVIGIGFSYSVATMAGWNVSPCMVPLCVEAGHRYRVAADGSNHARWRCWVEDEDTHLSTEGSFNAQEPGLRKED